MMQSKLAYTARVATLVTLAALFGAGTALAGSGDQKTSNAKWNQATVCSRKAYEQFPDYTPKANAERENFRRACLRAAGLPAENGAVPVPASN